MNVGFTGSRFFGSGGEGADYDLFAQDSPNLRARLMSIGCVSLPLSGRCGPNLVAMYRYTDPETGNQIDIGLHKSFERKLYEQRIACTTPFRLLLRHLPKERRYDVWRFIQSL
jgi:hypothetical protein